MKEMKAFCEECGNDVCYIVSEVQMEGELRGERYIYTGKKARCADCGAVLEPREVKAYNLRALQNIHREKNRIISLDKILEIPGKYSIGKRPLSLLLGWGEQTFSRYCEGDLPTRQYSDILIRIYEEPNYYAELLEENKDKLKTPSTYEKSRKAVDKLLGIARKGESGIDQAAVYLMEQCGDITPLALQKALYYVQGFYYAFYQEFLFLEECEAWVNGPVYREIYTRYREYCFDPMKRNSLKADADLEGGRNKKKAEFSPPFSSAEKTILDSVIRNICCYSGMVLERFTHTEMPWLVSRGNLYTAAVSSRVIPKALIGDYFSAVKQKYNMINPNDIRMYIQDMLEQI